MSNELRTKPIYGVFWKKSADTGDPDCLCSICRLPIADTITPILRLWDQGKPVGEARYHHECIPVVLGFREGFLDAERREREEIDEDPE